MIILVKKLATSRKNVRVEPSSELKENNKTNYPLTPLEDYPGSTTQIKEGASVRETLEKKRRRLRQENVRVEELNE